MFRDLLSLTHFDIRLAEITSHEVLCQNRRTIPSVDNERCYFITSPPSHDSGLFSLPLTPSQAGQRQTLFPLWKTLSSIHVLYLKVPSYPFKKRLKQKEASLLNEKWITVNVRGDERVKYDCVKI